MPFGMLQDVVKSASNPANVIKNKGFNTAINTSLTSGKASPFSWSTPFQQLFANQKRAQQPATPASGLPASRAPKAPKPKQRPQIKVQPTSAGKVDLMKGKFVTDKHGMDWWTPDGLGRFMTREENHYVKNQWKATNHRHYDRYRAPEQPKPTFKWKKWEPEPGEFLY